MTLWNAVDVSNRKPDFNNLMLVLQRQKPDRPTLFEFFLNERLYQHLGDPQYQYPLDDVQANLRNMIAFRNSGYDYFNMLLPGFNFSRPEHERGKSISQNEGAVIHDWASYRSYAWPDPHGADYAMLDVIQSTMPDGMKLIIYGPCGVLENAIELVGYEPLCLMLSDDEKLARVVFDEVGSRLLAYYERCSAHAAVGACIVNDDWGFKTQTLFSPRQMRRFVFPWHKRTVAAIHANGKPAILHSCGHFERIIEDIIVDIGFDARHSYEDNILPVEEAYDRYHDRIAILGGIDLDFVCRADPRQVYERSKRMLERAVHGGYALGTGNSVPDYVPDEGYFAMTRAALE
jgi:uroporphyrinogen decarboxylase